MRATMLSAAPQLSAERSDLSNNPNIDESIRGEVPKVKDLREKFIEIMETEIGPLVEADISDVVNKAADLMLDEVTKVSIMDPE